MTHPDTATGGMLRATTTTTAAYAATLADAPADTSPDEVLASARILRGLGVRTVIVAVLHARAHGRTWQAIGDQLGMGADTAEDVFGDYERKHHAGHPEPWTPTPTG